MKALITILIVSFLALLPSSADARSENTFTVCEYCDLVVGECKDVSEFPGGGGTGYTNCSVSGMTCHYSGSSCRDEFAFDEIGPDGMLRNSPAEPVAGEPLARFRSTVIDDNGVELTVDCRNFILGVKPTATAFLGAQSTTIIL